jgi:hypothetical protein
VGVARRRGINGRSTQGERPDWDPLVDAVGERIARDFMWMYEVELVNGIRLQVYKHIDTRRSAHLASNGQAYAYQPPNRYTPVPAWEVFSEVFRILRGLGGVTEGQILDSAAAVDRLHERHVGTP